MNSRNATMSIGLLIALVSQSWLYARDYEPTWESLESAPVPEWIMDAKFGI